jgi:hypothetical protein
MEEEAEAEVVIMAADIVVEDTIEIVVTIETVVTEIEADHLCAAVTDLRNEAITEYLLPTYQPDAIVMI